MEQQAERQDASVQAALQSSQERNMPSVTVRQLRLPNEREIHAQTPPTPQEEPKQKAEQVTVGDKKYPLWYKDIDKEGKLTDQYLQVIYKLCGSDKLAATKAIQRALNK